FILKPYRTFKIIRYLTQDSRIQTHQLWLIKASNLKFSPASRDNTDKASSARGNSSSSFQAYIARCFAVLSTERVHSRLYCESSWLY
ncbi:hypothetical protein TSAR_008697, partial [Trichomalopsis sarcophagae]